MTISVVIQNNKVMFKDCPVGLFVYNQVLCVKTKSNVYDISNGEHIVLPDESIVYPCYCEGGNRCITVEEKLEGTFDGWKRSSHPSYGLISFNRTYSSGANALFGSSIKHHNPIRMVISHAEMDRGLNKDWYHSRGRIVEIEMSQSQFADAITSFNQGDGVPCTILFTERDGRIPECKFINKTEQFRNEFREQLTDTESGLADCIKEVKDIFDSKKNLTKEDRKNILNALEKAKMNVSCNADFVYNSFAEQMDKTVKESKGEIESFMQNKIQNFAAMAMVVQSTKDTQMIEQIKNPIEIE